MLRTAPGCCDRCGFPRCLCYSPKCAECGKPLDAEFGCNGHTRAVDSNEPILLGRIAPPVTDGLIIEGIGTTRDWNAIEVPLAAGLTRLDGSTTYRRSGLDPKKMSVTLPLPLLWRHDWTKRIGEVFEISATHLAAHFRACIVPPGTPGYDSRLLSQVWADVRSRSAAGVSFLTELPDNDGSWRGKELSVCPVGGNPFAVITRAVFPDHHEVTRPMPTFTIDAARRAWVEFESQHNLLTRSASKSESVTMARAELSALIDQKLADVQTRGFADIYQGAHEQGRRYERGLIVTRDGSLWLSLTQTDGLPGLSNDWRLIVKKGRDARK